MALPLFDSFLSTAAMEQAFGDASLVQAMLDFEAALARAQAAEGLIPKLQSGWTLPTALAFLAWFVFAPQCISTIAVARRETNGWKWPLFMLAYLFGLAYIFAGITYWLAVAAGL